MKSIDIRSESAVKLLSEFLDMDAPYTPGERHVNAEHFAHGQCFFFFLALRIVPHFCSEVYSYVRSPYKNLFVYDTVAQVRFYFAIIQLVPNSILLNFSMISPLICPNPQT